MSQSDDSAAQLSRREHEAANARELLIVARCQRELRCGYLGPGKPSGTVAACERMVHEQWADDLLNYECRQRELGEELSDCLESIHDQDCDSPFDTLARISACTPRQVCLQ